VDHAHLDGAGALIEQDEDVTIAVRAAPDGAATREERAMVRLPLGARA
jgi:hypothetical protein